VKTITDFDLNALQLLTVLDQTRHVGRAAEVLGMSQSGFSTALARLRRRLDDELFVRVSGSMQPTHRAVTLVQTAREILMQVETGILGKTEFEPQHARVEFRLSMSDVAEVVFLPQLLGHLAQHAPLAAVHTSSPIGSSLKERLADGDVDLAIGYLPDLEVDSIFRQRLTSNTYACIVRSGHPVVAAGLSKAAYQELGHVVIATPAKSTSLLERALERQRISRRIVLSTPPPSEPACSHLRQRPDRHRAAWHCAGFLQARRRGGSGTSISPTHVQRPPVLAPARAIRSTQPLAA
jgi:DNA-binding transcriptional LysR family regulator